MLEPVPAILYPETVSGKLLPTFAVAKDALAAEVTNVILAVSAAKTPFKTGVPLRVSPVEVL